MKKYTAYWEHIVLNEDDVEVFAETKDKQFDDLLEAIAWLGFRDTNPHYYCIIYANGTGRIVHTGWLP